jgi:hypothetical protein
MGELEGFGVVVSATTVKQILRQKHLGPAAKAWPFRHRMGGRQ